MNLIFDNLPYPQLLQKLANGSLDQVQNLTRAIRLWALLRWLYSQKGYAALGENFTYTDWRKAFFTSSHKDEKQEDILKHQDLNCACIKTTKQWLLDLEVSIDKWQSSLQRQIPISNSDLNKLLEERLFAQVRKSLQSDLDLLISRNCLQKVNNISGRSKYYKRVEELQIFIEGKETHSNLTQKTQAYVAGALGMFSFLDPKYPLLAEEFSEEVDEENHRVFMYVDYVIPESSPILDAVDDIQSELQEIWESVIIPPLILTYYSAHQNQIKECVIYPVCIYFMERAKYLCAYGNTPHSEINWYKYRLDRIISKRLEVLDWKDPRVPQLLREKNEDNLLPTPKTVNYMLKQAWGCDFYKEKALMILRFEQSFHRNYVQGINIHEKFTLINYEQAVGLIKEESKNTQEELLEVIKSRSKKDVYYRVDYRMNDFYVVRWLRALGSKVEVLFPWKLRQEMAQEIQNTWNLYKV
jgi:CRISPR-associated protein (TIGR03985 family)